MEVPDPLMELFLMVHILILKVIRGLEDSRQAADLGLVENPKTEVELRLVDIFQAMAEFCPASNLKVERGLPDNLQADLGLVSNLGVEHGQARYNLGMGADLDGQARYNLDMRADLDAQVEIAEALALRKKVTIAEDVAEIIIATAVVVEEVMYQRHTDVEEQ